MISMSLKHSSGKSVEALVRQAKLPSDKLKWFVDWYPSMFDLKGKRLFEDSHWDVGKILEEGALGSQSEALVIESENKIQGFTTILTNYVGHDKNNCTYIKFLSSAPWNRRHAFQQNRRFRDIGVYLVGIAVAHSVKAHNSLAVELHSLPGAYNFYIKLGFRPTGNTCDGLPEMHISGTRASGILTTFLSTINS